MSIVNNITTPAIAGVETFEERYPILHKFNAIGKGAVIPSVKEGPKTSANMFSDIFSDEHKMGNITGLASTFMQAAALPSMMKSAKLANQTAQFNLDTGREEQARRNKNISGFNAVRTPQSTQSAFV